MADFSKDEELRIIPRDKPAVRLLTDALAPSEPSLSPEPIEPPPPRKAFRVVINILFAAAIVIGLGAIGMKYLHWPISRTASPSAFVNNIFGHAPTAKIAVTEEMLHVTSISVDRIHIAIVNGRRLEEGEELALATPAGVAMLRVVRIDKRSVHFDYAGRRLEAKLD